jgi:hypothetical protein
VYLQHLKKPAIKPTKGTEQMIINYTFDTNNPLDCQVLQILGKTINFVDGDTPPVKETTIESAAKTKPVAKKEESAPKKKPAPKKRKPKEKSKEALKKLDLAKMTEYLKERGEASLIECRILAKYYNAEFGEHEALIEILHKLGANDFTELSDDNCTKFAGAVMKHVEDRKATEIKQEEKDDDVFDL